MLFFNLRFNMGHRRELYIWWRVALRVALLVPQRVMHLVAGASTGRRVAPYRYFPFSNFALQHPSLTTQKKDCIENRYSLHSKIEIFMCRHRIVPSGVGFLPAIRCQLTSRKRNLLNFDFCASFFQLRFDGFCFVLGNFLFDSLRGFINQSLSFLQA